MVRTTALHFLVEGVEEFGAVFGEEREDGVIAFLQVPFGIDEGAELSGTGVDSLLAAEGFASGFTAVLLELIEDLGAALGHGGAKGGVEVGEFTLQAIGD
jgi:hypothetical protein